jgi:hypothetical protein
MGLEHNLNSWDQIFAAIQGGEFLQQLRNQRNDMMAALQEHFEEHRGGAKGSITIKLDFKLEKGGRCRGSRFVQDGDAERAAGAGRVLGAAGRRAVAGQPGADRHVQFPRVIDSESPRTPPADGEIRKA